MQAAQCMWDVVLLLTVVGTSHAQRVYGSDVERVVFWREESSGFNKLAYFLGKNIATIHTLLLIPAVFLATFYPSNQPRTPSS